MNKLIVIAGPCVVESEKVTMQVAEHLVRVCEKLPVELIFKASYRKANRTSIDSFTGIGDLEALHILARVRHELMCTDEDMERYMKRVKEWNNSEQQS
jgi:3-deoxy-D-manno-octulosonic acid (KDO) 8-phosphate synthase